MHPRIAYVLIAAALAAPTMTLAAPLTRDADPVLLSGQELNSLLGAQIERIVAFRYENGWEPIPMQIDERKWVDFGVVYNSAPIGLTTLAYADINTYCGADPNPLFDGDDELVFMASDAGFDAGSTAYPAHVLSGSGLKIPIYDILDDGEGYIYLFESDGTLDPGAGQDRIHYDFVLASGSYLGSYNTTVGPNPEHSTIWSDAYEVGFSDRWIRRSTAVSAGGAGGANILDRHTFLFAPDNCYRTEETFSDGEGAFFVNRDGPVRAIRSYMGANSGPLTQRDHFFYPQREDISTTLRVHAIPGMVDLFDYNKRAIGMIYYNHINLAGATVDGFPDPIIGGPIEWEMITGSQGSLTMVGIIRTNISGLVLTSYYSDTFFPSAPPCTGDDMELAASGPWIDQEIPSTDPMAGSSNQFHHTRVIYYDPPNITTAAAAHRHDQATTPLKVWSEPF
jgi:hypothetical protein